MAAVAAAMGRHSARANTAAPGRAWEHGRRARISLHAAAAGASTVAKPHRLSASVVIAAAADALPVAASAATDGGADYRICLVRRAARASFMPARATIGDAATSLRTTPPIHVKCSSDHYGLPLRIS